MCTLTRLFLLHFSESKQPDEETATKKETAESERQQQQRYALIVLTTILLHTLQYMLVYCTLTGERLNLNRDVNILMHQDLNG